MASDGGATLWVFEPNYEPVPLKVPAATMEHGNIHDLKIVRDAPIEANERGTRAAIPRGRARAREHSLTRVVGGAQLIRQAGEVLDSRSQLGRVSLTRVRGEEEDRLVPSDRICNVLADGDRVRVVILHNPPPPPAFTATASTATTSTAAATTTVGAELTPAQLREMWHYYEGEPILRPSLQLLKPNAQFVVSINTEALSSLSRPEKYRVREGALSNYLYLYQELGFSRTSVTNWYATSGLVTVRAAGKPESNLEHSLSLSLSLCARVRVHFGIYCHPRCANLTDSFPSSTSSSVQRLRP